MDWVVGIAVTLAVAQVGQPPADAQQGAAYARIEAQQCVIGNAALERVVSLSGGKVGTTRIRNKLARQDLPLESVEFSLTIDNTRILTAADFTLTNKEVRELAQGRKQLVLTFAHEKPGIEVQLRYEAAPGAPWLRKILAVRAVDGTKPLLNRIDVERFSTDAACEVGGLGQPVFMAGSVFTGLEYPAGHNEARASARAKPSAPRFLVALWHLPGKVLSPALLESKPAVLGAAGAGAVERGFAEYLARIRIPPRTHVHYNSWYDIRQDQMSTEAFLATFAEFKKHLCDKYGVRMDSFVPDDGWQDRSSIWEVSAKLFPTGLDQLSAGLKAGGSSLGLWHPLTAVQGNLVMKWCREHGYETDKAGTHLCLSAPRHNAQLREVMTRNVKRYDLTYLKHDFNSFACDGEGHGHLPRPEYGFEANVDAYIEMLKLLKQVNPKVFLNCTGGMWLSPWWLMYCDTVWRGANDTGYEQSHPFVDQRLQSISYVDGVLYDDFIKNRCQFPISALMTCGIVYGQLHMLGGAHEPLESWTDNTVWSVCLGLMMKELYITPRLLSETHWDVLGKSLRWAEANKDVLVATQMILGNPHRGEVIGYKHAVGDRTIVFLGNPSLRPQKAVIDFLPPGGDNTRRLVQIVYPYRKVLARDADPAERVEIALAPNEMLAIEALPSAADRRPVVEGCRYAIASESNREYVFDAFGESHEAVSVRIQSPARIAEILVDGLRWPIEGPYGHEATLSLTMPAAPQPLQIEDLSGTGAPLRNVAQITLPQGARGARFCLVCEDTASLLPLSPITVNGKSVKPRLLTGDRWKTFIVPLTEEVNTVAWGVQQSARPKAPFAAKSFRMSSYAVANRALGARRISVRLAEDLGPATPSLPTPFAVQKAELLPIQAAREVSTVPPGAGATIAAAQLKMIKAARLHLAIFGANPEPCYANKPVTLNGEVIGILPANSQYNVDQWAERVMEIPKDKLAAVAAENVITVANCGGDCFKFGDAALAVECADGTWVESDRASTVYCSCGIHGGWLHHEGTGFSQKSPPVKLTLPVKP
jgi:hypothetical protein